jgi:putative transcriptional regulator
VRVARPGTARDYRRSAPGAVAIGLGVALLLGAGRPAPPPEREGPIAERPAAGRFLVATEHVRGSFFQQSIVLLLSYADDGAIGLIVNRRTDLALHDVLKGAAEGAGSVYVGGPVEQGSVLVLLRSGSPLDRAMRVTGDLFVTVDPALLIERAGNPGADKQLRVYTGYAGWGPGQLDAEIARGDWIVAVENTDAVFDDAPDALWKKLHLRHHRLLVRSGVTRPAV